MTDKSLCYAEQAAEQYAQMARFCELPGTANADDRECVNALIAALEDLKVRPGLRSRCRRGVYSATGLVLKSLQSGSKVLDYSWKNLRYPPHRVSVPPIRILDLSILIDPGLVLD